MGLSNLPPGCSSPDGGIDHEYEAAIEAFCEIAQTAEDVKIINACAPAILDHVRDAYRQGLVDAGEQFVQYTVEGVDAEGKTVTKTGIALAKEQK